MQSADTRTGILSKAGYECFYLVPVLQAPSILVTKCQLLLIVKPAQMQLLKVFKRVGTIPGNLQHACKVPRSQQAVRGSIHDANDARTKCNSIQKLAMPTW